MPPVLKAPPPPPRGGPHRKPVWRGRIEGLGSPVPTSLRASTPTPSRASTPIAQPQSRSKVLCPNPDCPDRSKVIRGDQGLICESCGALVQEESGLVSEQGFGETESGRIVAQGTQIAQGQTHQRTNAAGGAYGNAGREATSSSERTRHQARNIMNSYCPILNIQSSDVDKGLMWFSLACTNGFLAGRTIESVAVAALYIACKRRREQVQGKKRPVYGLMLIDFAERLNMDVFALGKIYQDLYQKLWYNSSTREWIPQNRDTPEEETHSYEFQGMDPAVLVPKFVKDLEFDRRDEPKIQHDAIQIIKRMKRDWIHHGRRPSGVCGAAVLLAARMNNYRRTAREIVLTAKVTEITLNKRLQEFQDTQASTLSVTSFMKEAKVWGSIASEKEQEMDHHYLDENLPPVTKEKMKPKEQKKRGRPRKRPLPETAAEIEGDTGTPEPPAKRVRIDAEGYKIPEIPARITGGETPQDADGTPSSPQAQLQGLDDDATSSRRSLSPSAGESNAANTTLEKHTKKGRGPGWIAPPPSSAEIAMEDGILDAMDETIKDNPELSKRYEVHPSRKTRKSVPPSTVMEAGPSQPPSQEAQEDPQEDPMDLDTDPTQTIRPHKKDKILGPPADSEIGNLGYVSLSPTLKPDEFDSDEDVSTCTLTEEESRIKERVWVSMNADWLRKDHTKRIRKELKDADMRAKGLDPAEEELKKKAAQRTRKNGTKRPGRRGDVGYLKEGTKKKKAVAGEDEEEEGDDGDGEEGEAEPEEPRTAARAVRLMMENRGTFSQRINYDALDAIYGTEGTSEESAESRSATGEGRSRSASVATSTPGEAEPASSAGAQAGPSTAAPKKNTVTPSAIFRGNQERGKRRRTQNAVHMQKARLARNAVKKAAEAPEGKSASRSRSKSTPTSAAAGPSADTQSQTTSTPISGTAGAGADPQAPTQAPTQSAKEAQAQAQPPLPTPPVTQLSPSIPEPSAGPTVPKKRRRWFHSKPKSTTPAPLASQLGPQIPGIKITTGGRGGASKPQPPSEEEESEEETEEEEEEEDELEAALGGRLKARGSDDEGDDDDDDNDEDDEDEENAGDGDDDE